MRIDSILAFSLSCIIAVALDRITKLWAVSVLQTREIEMIPGIFSLRYAENTGIAFSLPLEGAALQFITLILIFVIAGYYWRYERTNTVSLLHIWYGLLLGGAASNAHDRLTSGFVVDMFALRFFSVFNVADIAISLGALCMLFIYSFHVDTRRTD